MSRVMRKILAIEKNSWKNLWKVRNILSIACNVSLDKMPKEVKKERRVLTREEQEKFFTFASSYIHINVLKFAVTTGCRIGEVLGLKWEDCDFEKREITINKTIHYSKASSPVEGSKFFYTTAKTISSNRVISMTDEVYEILQNQKIKQTEQKMWKRSIWKQHKEFQNLVFTCSDGSPVYYYNVNSAIKDYVAKINVIEIELAKEEKREPKIFELFTCHTLRHPYVKPTTKKFITFFEAFRAAI